MSPENTIIGTQIPGGPASRDFQRVAELVSRARSKNTIRAYRADWSDFEKWCNVRSLASLPATAETIALYIADLADRVALSTIRRRLVTISQAHKLAGMPSPCSDARVREVLKGTIREKGSGQKQKSALGTNELKAMVTQLPDTVAGIRDRALLLLGFLGAFRRSELVALEVTDLEFVPEKGVVVSVRRSKTDQDGEGRLVGVPYGKFPGTCPVLAVRAWLETAAITAGPLFRSVDRHGSVHKRPLGDKAVALVVKRHARNVGLDPSAFASHSLRSGFCTAAAAKDIGERLIMLQTGHKSVLTVRKYIRRGSVFTQNAAAALDL